VHFHLNEIPIIIFNLTGISGKYARNSNIQNIFVVGLRLPNNQIDKPLARVILVAQLPVGRPTKRFN